MKADSVTSRLLGALDSKWINRPLTVYALIAVGAAIVALLGIGALTVLYFGIWIVVAVALVLAMITARRPKTIVSPAGRAVISSGLPGTTKALLAALERADATNRSLIAEAAILSPVNNQTAANELAQTFVDLEGEIGTLIAASPVFDERWSLQWAYKPGWAVNQPYCQRMFSGAMLEELGRYMAIRGRQIGWMIEYLHTGDDSHVRHVKSWVKAAERERRAAEDEQRVSPTLTRRASPPS